MKKLVLFLTIIVIGLFFTNCQKEEMMDVQQFNVESIKTQLKNFPLPTEKETLAKINESSLKSAATSASVVKYFAMADYTWDISDTEAIKRIVCLEKDNSGYFSRSLTLEQTFSVNNGNLVGEGYNLDIHFGYQRSKIFRIKTEENANYIWHWVHFTLPNGEEFSFFDPNDNFSENHTVELPPIDEAVYQIRIGASVHYGLEKDKYEILSTYPFFEKTFEDNQYDDSEIEIEIDFDLKEESPYYLEIENNHRLWDAGNGWVETINVFGDNGEGAFRLEVLPPDTNSGKRSFAIPFSPSRIVVGYREETFYYSSSNLEYFQTEFNRIENGKNYYTVKK